MSRARKISSDLRHVATLAGTTAAVVEGAAIAAEKAKSVAEHIGPEREVESAPAVEAVVAAGKGRKKLLHRRGYFPSAKASRTANAPMTPAKT